MESKERSTASHPTIVVGFGTFGRDVLRRLLLTTASRGGLTYEEPRPGEDPSARALRDLALLHVDPERLAGADEEMVGGAAGAFEMMNELYRQIATVEPNAGELLTAMRAGGARLLSATERSARKERLRLGIDVFVVARPSYRELAQIVEMLRPVMDELSARPNLARPGQGADRINFIQILDFDHFWDNTAAARDLRRFLRGALDQWEERRQVGKGTFRRTYLLDRHTESGDRDSAFRLDEVALFLEYLLFEGRRDAEQHLFQPKNDETPPLAAFGVRVFERSAGLVTRLAAARFGVAWLDYLSRPDAGGPVRLTEKLPECTLSAIRERFRGADLQALTTAKITEIERKLAAISPSDSDFRARAESTLRDGCTALQEALGERVGERSREWTTGPMRDLRARITGAIDECLHGADPSSITAVVTAIAAFAREVDPAAEPASEGPRLDIDASLDELSRAASDHERFASEQVRTAELPRFWILLSAFLSAALVPPFATLIADVPDADPTERFQGYAIDTLKFVGKPLVLTLLLFGVFCAATLGFLQRSARRASRRALDFYVDPERGRLADAIRRLLDKGRPLRAALEAAGAASGRKMELTIRSEIQRELLRAHDRLKERARELSWARSQLRELLKIHGIDASASGASGASGQSGKSRTSLGPVRSSSRLDAKIEEMLSATPLKDQHFQDAQRSVKPFEGWAERHESSLLLFPLRLLDRLSESYRDPLDAELAVRGPAREHEALAVDLTDFVGVQGDFSTGFLWSIRPEERTHPTEAACIVPPGWSALPRFTTALQHRAFASKPAFFDGRAYLLKVTLGVPAEQIGEGQ